MKDWMHLGALVVSLPLLKGCPQPDDPPGDDDELGETTNEGDTTDDTDESDESDTDTGEQACVETSQVDEFTLVRSCEPHDLDPQLDPAQIAALATSNHSLTLELYHALREGQAANDNFTISATSLQTAFSLLYAGTVEPARSEIADTLHLAPVGDDQHVADNWLAAQLAARNLPATDKQDPVILNLVNGVWIHESSLDTVEPDYLDRLAIHYDTGLFLADFGQAEVERIKINAWVSERTNMLIPKLFDAGQIHAATSMVLVNALYLKAPWAIAFSVDSTSAETFTRLDASEVVVPMMYEYLMPSTYAEGTDWQALALALGGSELEFVVILPSDFAAFESALDLDTLDAILASLAEDRGLGIVDVEVGLPRLSVRAEFALVPELADLGMSAPFVDSSSFSGVAPGLGVIENVVQKTVVLVDEKGVEAAAATGITLGPPSIPEPIATVRCDRPFLLAIRDAPTDTLLFFGRVLDPSQP